jgi:hypothetical protein
MSAASFGAIAERIAQIIPRLGSDHDGEVVATAAAIGRVLKSAGADWHDLVDAVKAGAVLPPPKEEPPPRSKPAKSKDTAKSPPSWNNLGQRKRMEWLNLIAECDRLVRPTGIEFALSIASRLRRDPNLRLTERQIAFAEDLIRQVWAAGLRP